MLLHIYISKCTTVNIPVLMASQLHVVCYTRHPILHVSILSLPVGKLKLFYSVIYYTRGQTKNPLFLLRFVLGRARTKRFIDLLPNFLVDYVLLLPPHAARLAVFVDDFSVVFQACAHLLSVHSD